MAAVARGVSALAPAARPSQGGREERALLPLRRRLLSQLRCHAASVPPSPYRRRRTAVLLYRRRRC